MKQNLFFFHGFVAKVFGFAFKSTKGNMLKRFIYLFRVRYCVRKIIQF